MDKDTQAQWKNWSAITIFIVCLLLLSALACYIAPSGYARAYTKVVPLPVAFVDGKSIRLSDLYQRVQVAKKLENHPEEGDILNRMVIESKVAALAKKYNLSVSQEEIDNAVKSLGATSSELNKFGIDEKYYKENIVKSDLLIQKLASWLASQKNQNSDAYTKVDSAQRDLKAGVAFEQVAEKYSDDSLNAKVGGDLGFVGIRDIFPEIYSELAKIKDHDTHVVYSRLGVHILQVLNTDNNGPDGTQRFHIRQIFIKTQDFNSWLDKQGISVIKLL